MNWRLKTGRCDHALIGSQWQACAADSTDRRNTLCELLRWLLILQGLAPAVLDSIASGDQPDGLTTDNLIKTGFSEVWSQQKKQFAEI